MNPRELALVTCDTESRVALLDVKTGRILRSLHVLPGPRSIERVGAGDALVCHTDAGAITIIGRDLKIKHVLHGFTEPRYTAAHPDRRHAFVSDSGSKEVLTVDLAAGTVVGRVKLDGWARHLTLDPAAKTLWVGLGSISPRLSIVDVSVPSRPRFVRMIKPPFAMHDVGFLPDGQHVWVTAGADSRTAIYHSSGEARLVLPAYRAPQHVSFLGDRAYVTSGVDGTLTVHSLRNGRALHTTRIPVGSYNVQAGAVGRVLSPSLNHGTLCVLGANGNLLHEVHVAASSHDACFIA